MVALILQQKALAVNGQSYRHSFLSTIGQPSNLLHLSRQQSIFRAKPASPVDDKGAERTLAGQIGYQMQHEVFGALGDGCMLSRTQSEIAIKRGGYGTVVFSSRVVSTPKPRFLQSKVKIRLRRV
jgi:hypothetical protein